MNKVEKYIIMRMDMLKEELQKILMKMNQVRPKIKEFRVCPFGMSGKIPDLHQRLPAGAK